MSDFVSVPPAPSPAFLPPDEKTAREHKVTTRRVKTALLVRFLRERLDGHVDGCLLWSLFQAPVTTPVLDAYFDKLAEEHLA